jgi:hypothetical protein
MRRSWEARMMSQRPVKKRAVDGREYWLATHELFAVDHRDAIIAALDFVFVGF